MDLLGLALVWLGLALCVFRKIIVFSNGSAWFGLGLALCVFRKLIVFSNGSAWFALVWLCVCFVEALCFPTNLLVLPLGEIPLSLIRLRGVVS